MRFDELPAGSQIFVDANIFIYHFSGVSEDCSSFLERCEREEIVGFTTTNILLETMHRLMMLEAVTRGLVTPGNLAKKLKGKPEIITRLATYAEQVKKIPAMNINIVPLTQDLCYQALTWQQQYGLMTNDSILLAACQEYKCWNLASNDLVFVGVREITLWQPADVE
ncbi:type II toxin-antitoxin system VapC family toxin [Moorella sulfitireducens]|uniref:type II toxin-antitoxin system VapC family toxin n=1 Tax=Neomoorella sulfitireducens TaxID=2972948 RepID=UPI0021AC8A31|nr:PIN domain-containing protein [Moorella sulfitireducens]